MRPVTGELWLEFPFAEDYLAAIRGDKRVVTGVVEEVTTEVATEVKLLQALMTEDLSRQALQSALGLKNNEHFRKAYLLPALDDGLIEMTIPDKPTSRLQKYRLTDAGRVRLNDLV